MLIDELKTQMNVDLYEERRPSSMKKYHELKDKVDQSKEQVASIDAILHDLRQKAFVTEEILWGLKRNLEVAQRELLSSLKELSLDEVLAVRSGLTLEEIKRGKVLIAKLTRPAYESGSMQLIKGEEQEEA